MKISVVIPAYNEEEYLEKCLKSIFSQVEPADEVIVVDNGSTDETARIAKRFDVRVVTELQQGMTCARNTGFESAKYPVIARTDADTVVSRNWIRDIKRNFQDESVVAISGPARSGSKAFTSVVKLFFPVNKLLLGHNVLLGPNYAIRKSTWKKIRSEICLNDEKVHEDLDLAIHAAKYGKILYDAQLVVKTSARRLKNDPGSLLGEYFLRWLATYGAHTTNGRKKNFPLRDTHMNSRHL